MYWVLVYSIFTLWSLRSYFTLSTLWALSTCCSLWSLCTCLTLRSLTSIRSILSCGALRTLCSVSTCGTLWAYCTFKFLPITTVILIDTKAFATTLSTTPCWNWCNSNYITCVCTLRKGLNTLKEFRFVTLSCKGCVIGRTSTN